MILGTPALVLEQLSPASPPGRLEQIRKEVAELYVLRRDYVFRYLVANSRNRTEAEDLTHEVFLRLYTHYASGQSVESPIHWLITVARNLLIDQVRRRQYQPPRIEAAWKLVVQTRPDRAPTAEQSLVAQARTAQIHRALTTLQGLEKECLSLRVEGLAFREIAAALEIPMWLAVERTNSAIIKVRRRVKV